MILARFQNVEVEVVSTFEGSSGRKLATVKALHGKPFCHQGMDGFWVSEYDHIPPSLLKDVRRVCTHKHASLVGGQHFSAGEVWDDIKEICDDCGEELK